MNFQYLIADDTSPSVLQNQLGYIGYGVIPILLLNFRRTAKEPAEKEANIRITCVRPMPKADGLVGLDSDVETGAALSGKFMAITTALGVIIVLGAQSSLF